MARILIKVCKDILDWIVNPGAQHKVAVIGIG
jgi:hypothetical protein